jgi:hypothetical protein
MNDIPKFPNVFPIFAESRTGSEKAQAGAASSSSSVDVPRPVVTDAALALAVSGSVVGHALLFWLIG